MKLVLSRRAVVLSGLAFGAISSCARTETSNTGFSTIEAAAGGRLGVAALDLSSGNVISNRGDERFAMCSTFKWLLGGLILQRVEAGTEDLTRNIPIRSEDLVFYSPVTEPLADKGGLSVGALCAATIATSDNTAANLLLGTLGGPLGFTSLVRALGDPVTRLDRLEPQLNENAPDDPQDTSSPLAMLQTMRTMLFGDVLSDEGKVILRSWMTDASTGLDRLRAGLPPLWIKGDKTGTSSNDQNNDVAFAIPPAQTNGIGPVLIVSYANIPDPVSATANAIHADVARHVSGAFGL